MYGGWGGWGGRAPKPQVKKSNDKSYHAVHVAEAVAELAEHATAATAHGTAGLEVARPEAAEQQRWWQFMHRTGPAKQWQQLWQEHGAAAGLWNKLMAADMAAGTTGRCGAERRRP